MGPEELLLSPRLDVSLPLTMLTIDLLLYVEAQICGDSNTPSVIPVLLLLIFLMLHNQNTLTHEQTHTNWGHTEPFARCIISSVVSYGAIRA